MNGVIKTVLTFLATFAAGVFGMFFVGGAVSTWYAALNKPPLTPPDIVFPFVWFLLYVLMALAASIVWLRPHSKHIESWTRFYFIQLLFNAGWTMFFFGFHSMFVALLDILVLGFMVLALCVSAWELDRRVTYLLLPYALWVLFAIYLTIGFFVLN